MIRLVWLLVACAAVVIARRSPNAVYIEQLVKSHEGSRYSNDVLEDAELDVPGLIQKYGYPVEVHNVVTSDGYILEAHRIPYGRDSNNFPDTNKPVVFIMHGLLSSSADFIVLGPGNALGYLLAEAGYDVWLGNARGNFYSRRHLNRNPDRNSNFWRFSWDEIGNIDLPTFIDYILEQTGQSKLHYIGHSQGGTSFLVLNSLRPEYNAKFITFQGLAPASFFTNNEHEVFNTMAKYESILETAASALGIVEISSGPDFLAPFCNSQLITSLGILGSVCSDGLSGILASGHYNQTMVPVILGHVPAGASLRQFAHYGQVIRFDAFRRYNFNSITNLSVYGRLAPPEYDLTKVTVPVYLHYGLNDDAVDHKDIYLLASKLPNTVGAFQVPRPDFNHFDFIWGNDVKENLYINLIEQMKIADSNP